MRKEGELGAETVVAAQIGAPATVKNAGREERRKRRTRNIIRKASIVRARDLEVDDRSDIYYI
jgi:hypothetical protein